MNIRIPSSERKLLRNARIRALWAIKDSNGDRKYTQDEICKIENVSKTTVFFAIRGRSKKIVEKR